MFAYRSDPAVTQHQTWEPHSVEEVKSFIDRMSNVKFNTNGWYQIAITLQGAGDMIDDKDLIGDCGVHILETDSRIAEIAITIAPAQQSKGYATEALKAILTLLFVRLGKHRVFASVDPSNLASIALMGQIGLRKEGHFVQSLWWKDRWVDDVVFAMLASEFLLPPTS